MKISIIGLGYVGLPLAVSLAKHFSVVGFDINSRRIKQLKNGVDETHEITPEILKKSTLVLTDQISDLTGQTIHIVTVPTPTTAQNKPDLTPLEKASHMIGAILKKGDIVVYESTVYPGVTESHCGAILESASGLVSGKDFFLGYSPERINPGDREHTVEKITKVVAAQTPAVAETLKTIYEKVTKIFVAKDIKTAEAAKVIENTQRDINIAFMNEIAQIFHEDGLSTKDILEAASTKWNFLPFKPGLVGGHCIGVDPYYLADYAEKLNINPRMILAGRHINDGMPHFFAHVFDKHLSTKAAKVLVLGITFKEDIPDIRNSKVFNLIQELKKRDHLIDVVDPLADPDEVKEVYGLSLTPIEDATETTYDGIIGAVKHQAFRKMEEDLKKMTKPRSPLLDIQNMWDQEKLRSHFIYITY